MCNYDQVAEEFIVCGGRGECRCPEEASFDDALVGTADPLNLPYPIGQAVQTIAVAPAQVVRLERLISIQARLRHKWKRALDTGDFFTAKVMVKRLHQVTFATWGEKELFGASV